MRRPDRDVILHIFADVGEDRAAWEMNRHELEKLARRAIANVPERPGRKRNKTKRNVDGMGCVLLGSMITLT